MLKFNVLTIKNADFDVAFGAFLMWHLARLYAAEAFCADVCDRQCLRIHAITFWNSIGRCCEESGFACIARTAWRSCAASKRGIMYIIIPTVSNPISV